MALDPLEFGQLLMSKRRGLVLLAGSLSSDAELAGAAVRCTLCEAWRRRAQIQSERELDGLLAIDLPVKINFGLEECGANWPPCARFRGLETID